MIIFRARQPTVRRRGETRTRERGALPLVDQVLRAATAIALSLSEACGVDTELGRVSALSETALLREARVMQVTYASPPLLVEETAAETVLLQVGEKHRVARPLEVLMLMTASVNTTPLPEKTDVEKKL